MAGKKPVRSMGRPTKYSQEIAERICVKICEGVRLEEICRLDDMPDRSTVYRWTVQNEEFCNMYARARVVSASAFEDKVLERADGVKPETAAADNVAINAYKWAAAKRAPKVYGDKITQEHTGAGGKDLPTPTLVIATYQKPDDTDTD